MQQITLSQVLPEVFRERTDLVSEVWRQELSFERGRHYLIEASSGAGKSSLCSFLYGWRGDYLGRIAFDGKDIRTLTPQAWSALRCRSMSFLFQEMRLFDELTAWENVWLKNQLTGHKDKKTLEGYFEALGIADKLHAPARLLSLGQQQRVAAIRALAQPFDFLLLDEPISHLDEANAETLARLIEDEARSQGATVLTTSVGKHLPLNYSFTYKL
ncbi:MAG: ATP-binding cassette domain-containing protein [Porphyromonas sp.]